MRNDNWIHDFHLPSLWIHTDAISVCSTLASCPYDAVNHLLETYQPYNNNVNPPKPSNFVESPMKQQGRQRSLVDLIQSDFPQTPSNVLTHDDKKDEELLKPSGRSRLDLSGKNLETPLEDVSQGMEKLNINDPLYVKDDGQGRTESGLFTGGYESGYPENNFFGYSFNQSQDPSFTEPNSNKPDDSYYYEQFNSSYYPGDRADTNGKRRTAAPSNVKRPRGTSSSQPRKFAEQGGYSNGYSNPKFNNKAPPHASPKHPSVNKPMVTLPKITSRSQLLEEFRNSKNSRKYELKDIVNHFVEFSGDQHGSRFIQQKLESATALEKQMVFKEIQPQALQLMTDVFGNYVIQKFFEHGTAEQKKCLSDALEGHVLELSLQMYGCRVVQKALEVVSVEQQEKRVRELEGYVLKCIKDQNGNHVIQKVIEQVPPHLVLFIIETFKGRVQSLATHPYGCRVIQRILEHCSSPQKTQMINDPIMGPGIKAQLDVLKELLSCTANLVQDQYGNYVVQHILEHGKPEDKHEIIKHLSGKVYKLSQHKFASNVIEKCVIHGSKEDRKMIVEEILTTENNKKLGKASPLERMMKDQYANYVIQRILDICDTKEKEMLISKIKPYIQSLKRFPHGKHIISRLEKITGKHF